MSAAASNENRHRPASPPWWLLGPLLAVFFGLGAWGVLSQAWRLTTYRPVPATVLSTDVRYHMSTGGTRHSRSQPVYTPVVTYRYLVGGRAYTSDAVHPIKESRSEDWARDVVAPFTAGGAVTAYYDPRDPSRAFLVRRYSFLPYIFVLMPCGAAALLLTVGPGAAARWGRTLWPGLLGAAFAAHYFLAAGRPYGPLSVIVCGVYVATVLVALRSPVLALFRPGPEWRPA